MHCCLFLLIATINVINTASANPRRKRAEPERAPVVLQLPPDLFDAADLKEVYAGISGDGPLPGERQVFLELEPKKRDVEDAQRGENVASFNLRVNPFVPRNPMYMKNYTNANCVEAKQWCVEEPSSPAPICPPVDTPTPIPTTCGPRKPSTTFAKQRFSVCNFERAVETMEPQDPCDECSKPKPSQSTRFVACYSMPPPTKAQRLKYCNPTTMPCHNVPCTYKVAELRPTAPPPSPPTCDPSQVTAQNYVLDSSAALVPPKYYILVKRSPGDWGRDKRDTGWKKRRFRIVHSRK